MDDFHPLPETEKRKLYFRCLRKAAIASKEAGGSFFGGFVVAFVFFQSCGGAWTPSILIGILTYSLFLNYFFPRIYSEEFKEVIDKFYYEEFVKIRHYAIAHEQLAAAFAIIHRMNRTSNLTFEVAVSELSSFCTLVKEFFQEKNGAVCACSIKLLVKKRLNQVSGDYQVVTICRDSKSRSSREQTLEKGKKTTHTVKKNTCFFHFFQNVGTYNGRFFLCNDLTKLLNYQNSSFVYYGEPTKDSWTLPYKSEIVVPLSPKDSDENSLILGYFCVDCEAVDKFHVKYDPEILIGIADGLYNTLQNQVNKKNGIASK